MKICKDIDVGTCLQDGDDDLAIVIRVDEEKGKFKALILANDEGAQGRDFPFFYEYDEYDLRLAEILENDDFADRVSAAQK